MFVLDDRSPPQYTEELATMKVTLALVLVPTVKTGVFEAFTMLKSGPPEMFVEVPITKLPFVMVVVARLATPEFVMFVPVAVL